MQLTITSGAYVDSSIDVNNQKCINWFPADSGPSGRGVIDGKSAKVMLPTAGLDLLVTLPGTVLRCLTTVRGYTYAIVDSTVYKLAINNVLRTASYTSLGTIASTTGRVYTAANPTQLIFVDGSDTGYILTDATDTLAAISDGDFPAAGQVVYIDGYFIVSEPGSGRFYASALNNGTSWNAADVATAENSTDNIMALCVVKGELWVIGENSVEIWYNAGNPTGMPLSPRTGLEIRIGCQATDSVVVINDLVVWLDDRGYIVQSDISALVRNNNSGYDLNIVSTEALTREILGYNTVSDAMAVTYNDRGHLMYQISFPTEQRTHVWDYITKEWHSRAYYDSYTGELQHHIAQYCTQYKNLTIVGGVRTASLYLMDNIYDDDDGVSIRRIKNSIHLYDKDNNKKISIYRLTLRVGQVRVPVSGVYTDPQVIMRYSNDGGHSWSASLFRSLGAVGQNSIEVAWNLLGTSREWLFEFTVSDPVSIVLIDAWADVELEV